MSMPLPPQFTPKYLDGVITAVYGATGGEGLPSAITYDAISMDAGGHSIVTGGSPQRRINTTTDIRAAQVGDWCVIKAVADSAAQLWFVPEETLYDECVAGSGGALRTASGQPIAPTGGSLIRRAMSLLGL